MKCPKCGYINWSKHPELEETLETLCKGRWYTTRWIADILGVTIQTAHMRLRKLEELGQVKVEARRACETGGIENLWVVTR